MALNVPYLWLGVRGKTDGESTLEVAQLHSLYQGRFIILGNSCHTLKNTNSDHKVMYDINYISSKIIVAQMCFIRPQ